MDRRCVDQNKDLRVDDNYSLEAIDQHGTATVSGKMAVADHRQCTNRHRKQNTSSI